MGNTICTSTVHNYHTMGKVFLLYITYGYDEFPKYFSIANGQINKLEKVLEKLQKAGLKVNASKSHFVAQEIEYLGYWLTRHGIQPIPKKVEAVFKKVIPCTRRELRRFI